MTADKDWRAVNRANWDERVAVHLKAPGYDLAPLRAGRGTLNVIEEAELGDVRGLRVLHLQCHFGADTLSLAQRDDGDWHWPDRPWLPLAVSLQASRRH